MAANLTGFRRIDNDSVLEKTGKSWDEWYAILDAWDAPSRGHTDAAKHMREAYELTAWWAQAVTIRYEWERGLRD
jgi:hypothetical protein